ncbi:MAG: hypothetical protein HYU64_12045 [Armatimonadetes bacterium]|nr:hypothetical protein [Armatimonadota bacterium]
MLEISRANFLGGMYSAAIRGKKENQAPEEPVNPAPSPEPTPNPEPPPEPRPAKAKWGILVYFASDNNLYSFEVNNLKDLEKVGSTPQMHVVAQMDHGPKNGNTLRYYVTKASAKDQDSTGISSPVIGDLGKKVDTADPKVLKEFIVSSMKAYPAEHYLLVLNDHGAGFVGGMSDDSSGGLMKLPQMREALEAAEAETGQKLDIVGFDACLMAQSEVGYELRNSANILMASEETEGGYGWHYNHLFGSGTLQKIQKILEKKLDMSPEELAQHVVKDQEEHQGDIPTFSAAKLTEMENLKGASEALAQVILKVNDKKEKEAIRKAVENSQHFGGWYTPYKDFRDVGHLAKLLSGANGVSAPVKEAAQALEGASKAAILANQSTSNGYKDATGLSTYFPLSVGSGGMGYGYKKTAWAADTQWDEAIESLAKKDPKLDELQWHIVWPGPYTTEMTRKQKEDILSE